MKRIALFVLALFITPALRAQTVVQGQMSSATSTGKNAITFTNPAVSGDSLVIFVRDGNVKDASQLSVSDTAGNTYAIQSVYQPGFVLAYARADGVASVSTITVTDPRSNQLGVNGVEVSGISGYTTALYQNIGSGNNPALNNVSTAYQSLLLVGFAYGIGTPTTLGAGLQPIKALSGLVTADEFFTIGSTTTLTATLNSPETWTVIGLLFEPPSRTVAQIPVTLNLYFPDGTTPSGNLTLYQDVFNASGTVNKTTIAVWPLSNGSATATIPAAMSGTYEFDLNGSVNASVVFQPGVYQELLNSAGSITAAITLDPATGQPLPSYTFQVLPKSN